MAVDPVRHVVAPRFLGGLIAVPLLAAISQLRRHLWRAADRRDHDAHRARHLLVADASAVALRDVNEGLIKSVVFGAACSLIAVL